MSDETKRKVGQIIKQARKQKGYTQQEMADKLSISKSAYNRYEGGSQNITIDTLQKIGDVLGLQLLVTYH